MPHSTWNGDVKADRGAGGKGSVGAPGESRAHTEAGRPQLQQQAQQEAAQEAGERKETGLVTLPAAPLPLRPSWDTLFSSSKPASYWVKNQAKGRVRCSTWRQRGKQSRLQSQAVPSPGLASGPSKPCL